MAELSNCGVPYAVVFAPPAAGKSYEVARGWHRYLDGDLVTRELGAKLRLPPWPGRTTEQSELYARESGALVANTLIDRGAGVCLFNTRIASFLDGLFQVLPACWIGAWEPAQSVLRRNLDLRRADPAQSHHPTDWDLIIRCLQGIGKLRRALGTPTSENLSHAVEHAVLCSSEIAHRYRNWKEY